MSFAGVNGAADAPLQGACAAAGPASCGQLHVCWLLLLLLLLMDACCALTGK